MFNRAGGCYNCGSSGHRVAMCPNPKATGTMTWRPRGPYGAQLHSQQCPLGRRRCVGKTLLQMRRGGPHRARLREANQVLQLLGDALTPLTAGTHKPPLPTPADMSPVQKGGARTNGMPRQVYSRH
ncbi:hypothetical protein DFH09DRAFT_1086003 [Mycena vulgaris]|nr:hypothetical protein DFH09DRAFT_1086003 [Mycena vulgaris]